MRCPVFDIWFSKKKLRSGCQCKKTIVTKLQKKFPASKNLYNTQGWCAWHCHYAPKKELLSAQASGGSTSVPHWNDCSKTVHNHFLKNLYWTRLQFYQNTSPTFYGYGVVMHLIHKEKAFLSYESSSWACCPGTIHRDTPLVTQRMYLGCNRLRQRQNDPGTIARLTS